MFGLPWVVVYYIQRLLGEPPEFYVATDIFQNSFYSSYVGRSFYVSHEREVSGTFFLFFFHFVFLLLKGEGGARENEGTGLASGSRFRRNFQRHIGGLFARIASRTYGGAYIYRLRIIRSFQVKLCFLLILTRASCSFFVTSIRMLVMLSQILGGLVPHYTTRNHMVGLSILCIVPVFGYISVVVGVIRVYVFCVGLC